MSDQGHQNKREKDLELTRRLSLHNHGSIEPDKGDRKSRRRGRRASLWALSDQQIVFTLEISCSAVFYNSLDTWPPDVLSKL